MITGFNTDIQYGGVTYHVQTEDKGLETPLILSLVYVGGAIIASKRSRYEDLIESGFDEQALTERLQRQHKLICAAIRQGRVDELKKMAEPAPKREAARTAETARREEAAGREEAGKREEAAKPVERPKPDEPAKPDKPPRREAAKRAEPPARQREASPEEPLPEPRTEPRPAPPETKREAPPAQETRPAQEAPPARASAPAVNHSAPVGAAPVNHASPAGEPAPAKNEAPVLLTGEDQYLDEIFQRGTTGALAPEQGVEAERTPERPTAPPPSPPPLNQSPPPVQPRPLNQPPQSPSFQSAPPPLLIPPDAVRVIEEAAPAAFVGAAEEIYLTLLDDEGDFRAGQLATIKIRVGRGQFGQRPVADAAVTIKVLGTTFRPLILSTRTGADGVAVVRALLPRFTSGRAAIIIRASAGEEFAEMRRIIHQA